MSQIACVISCREGRVLFGLQFTPLFFWSVSASPTSCGAPQRPITADPELGEFECDDTDFVVLVCDGVSEGDFSNAEVIQLAAEKMRETNDAGVACTAICHKAVETNSKDNITCMIVLLQGGEGRELEFNPGPLTCAEHKNFLTAYISMAEKAGTTLAKAAELRYELIEDILSGAKVVTVGSALHNGVL